MTRQSSTRTTRDRPDIPKSPYHASSSSSAKKKLYVEMLKRIPAELQRTSSASSVRSTDSNMYHPPSLGLSSSTIQRRDDDEDDKYVGLETPSFVRDASEIQHVYHPPVQPDVGPSDDVIEQGRYRAALYQNFTPRGVQEFSRNMDNHLIPTEIMSSATESTMGNYTTDTNGTYGTSYTTNDDTSAVNMPGASPKAQVAPTFGLSSDYSTNNNNHASLLLEEHEEDDYFRVKQPFGYCSIVITAIQLLVLMMQLALCGVASLDVNVMIGPYPETFSEWGGKNIYFLVQGSQWFRLVTPAVLHVGILHLLANAYVQLETCAFFEREWGSLRWISLYIISEIGSIAISCIINPETIAVGSSGAVMGLFGAKFAQLATYLNFELVGTKDPNMRLEQLSGIMCSLSIIAVLSVFPYIDWSGHVGGFCTGFCAGIVAFAGPIRSSASKFLWILFGIVLVSLGFYFTFDTLFTKMEIDGDLADPCEYFRNLYPEDYDCGVCAWG